MFTPATFAFLRDLAAHNTRDWFEAHRARYEADAKGPMLAFIDALAPRLRAISPHFDAGPRSMFRIHRDTRFSADKSPYKTHIAAQFRHRGAADGVHAPGYYLHLAPDGVGDERDLDGVLAGAGVWRPDAPVLRAVRARMLEEPDRWRAATAGLTLGGESLKRPPPGVPVDHPLLTDLRRKDYTTLTRFTEADAVRADFVERVAEVYRAASGLQALLCAEVGLPFSPPAST